MSPDELEILGGFIGIAIGCMLVVIVHLIRMIE